MPAISRILGVTGLLCLSLSATTALAVEPGVDIAAPRVAITIANGSTLRFVPTALAVEQGDYVRWNWTSGSHTTTSGIPCTADSLWNSSLNSTTTSFTRQVVEAPGVRQFFCNPHCGLGMTGQVNVTTVIDLTIADSAGSSQLTWTGGGGLYRVFRSDSPLFATSAVLTAAGGTTQTAFLDQTGGAPPLGRVQFYLVMNQF